MRGERRRAMRSPASFDRPVRGGSTITVAGVLFRAARYSSTPETCVFSRGASARVLAKIGAARAIALDRRHLEMAHRGQRRRKQAHAGVEIENLSFAGHGVGHGRNE